MKRFFNWLFGTFRPDEKKYVKNIKGEETKTSQTEAFVQAKRKKSSSEILAWIQTDNIKENKEDNQGVTQKIVLKNDTQFIRINSLVDLQVKSNKKGLSKVDHSVIFNCDSTDKEAILAAVQNKNMSFLRRTVEGDYYFLGEKNGLSLIEAEDDKLHFKGSESDVFFKVTEDCFIELLPNIEN